MSLLNFFRKKTSKVAPLNQQYQAVHDAIDKLDTIYQEMMQAQIRGRPLFRFKVRDDLQQAYVLKDYRGMVRILQHRILQTSSHLYVGFLRRLQVAIMEYEIVKDSVPGSAYLPGAPVYIDKVYASETTPILSPEERRRRRLESRRQRRLPTGPYGASEPYGEEPPPAPVRTAWEGGKRKYKSRRNSRGRRNSRDRRNSRGRRMKYAKRSRH